MSLSIQYESIEEAEMRLTNTVVLYDGKPVYIDRVANHNGDDVFRVYARPLPLDKRADPLDEQFRKFISSKKFDLSGFKMGFMNIKGHSVYMSRLPRKQYKQGLAQATLGVEYLGKQGPYDMKAAGLDLRLTNLIYLKEFAAMLEGKYPSFNEAKKMLDNGANTVAFHREFALGKDDELDGLVYLYHKRDKVGFILNDTVNLANKMQCLKECLLEAGLRI